MADLTQGSIADLLGLLKTAIKDEAQLLGGVHSNMKFIKDEMDSMNGFLLHLNKIESEHDDQVRAWMKQVREISYVAEDCVDRYVRDIGRHSVRLGDGCLGPLAMVLLFIRHPRACFQLHTLGKQIAELKARVHDVGKRRLRYDVSVPGGRDLRRVDNMLPSKEEEERREAFVRALEEKLKEEMKQAGAPAPLGSLLRRKMGGLLQDALAVPSAALGLVLGGGDSDIIRQLPPVLVPSEAATIRGILKKCSPPDDHLAASGGGGSAASSAEAHDDDEGEAFRCTKKMFLCALYVYPYPTKHELEKLKEGVEAPGVAAKEARVKVMVFCYSLLSTQQKTCLQYLTAFLDEKKISRTSMVRRWVAEGHVGTQPGGGVRRTTTPEEAGERCFRELLLRAFIRPSSHSDAGTVKSCVMDAPAREFILDITKNENFVADLPVHLDRQLEIRRIVNRGRPSISMAPLLTQQPRNTLLRRRCCPDDHDALEDDTTKDPMDELVKFLKKLPELYRLNVLDLGGCMGLKTHHLQSFGKVDCLKYLSLRNTDVSRLHAKHINKLKLLETLDIRGTNIPPRDTKELNLPKLKHLLAGRFTTMPTASNSADARTTPSSERASLATVHMPRKIASMRDMETLSHVQVSSSNGAELQGVARLQELRKLGVVVHVNTTTAALLARALYKLAGSLRSLSVWVVVPRTTTTTTIQQGGGGGALDISSMHETPPSLVLENLDINGKMSLPSWVGRAPKLTNVTLRDTEMDGRDALRRLSTVQSLRCLKISRKAFTERALRFKDVQFQALKFLVIEGGDAITQVAFFADDAAPKLEKIVWTIEQDSKMYNEDLIVGINHLSCLKVIEIRVGASFKHTNPLEWTKQQTNFSARTTNPRYCIRYIKMSSDQDQLIGEVPRTATHTTFSLPVGVIN